MKHDLWNGPHFPSIRAAIVLELILAIAPALWIIVWTGIEYGSHMQEQIRQEAIRQVDSFAEVQERITRSAEQTLLMISSLPAIRSGKKEEMLATLKAIYAANPEYLNYTITDTNGVVTASARAKPGIDLSSRDHIRRALAEKRFVAGNYFLNILDRSPSIAYSYPILDDREKLMGTVSLGVKFDSYGPFFERLELPKKAFLGLVDRNGIRVFFHPSKDSNPVGAPIKESVWARIRDGGAGTFVELGSDCISRFYAFKSLRMGADRPPYLYVVFGIPNNAFSSAGTAILRRNLLIMAAVALFAFASSLLLTKQLFGHRLSAVIGTTDRIRQGDLSARADIPADRSDLGRIAGALNSMAETLQLREKEAKEFADSLAASLREKDILIKEVHHRVKNNFQMIMALIRLQGETEPTPEAFRDSLENRVASMSMVHEMLYQSEDMGSVDLGEYAKRLLDRLSDSAPDYIVMETELDSVFGDVDQTITFGLLLNELVLNAYKHAFTGRDSGLVRITLKAVDGSARLEVRDDGSGLPADFTVAESKSLGLQLVDGFAAKLRGSLTWGNNDDRGAYFTVVFPALARGAAGAL